jgi:uncharacterized lipoprotein YddW (UPF0748 family)
LCVLGLAAAPSLPAQQFRAAWADVFHPGMQSAAQIDAMVARLAAGRYNAVLAQVLAYMDRTSTPTHGAYWKSSLLPWSGYVTGSFDPLAYLCQQAHANGIEVHAWLGGSGGGMYRVSLAWPPAGNPILTAHPEWMMVPRANSEGNAVVPVGPNFLLDMGSSDAQEYLVSIVRELVTNYPIDGIHWDDEIDPVEHNAGMGFPAYRAALYPRSGLARYRANTGFTGTPGVTDAAYDNYRRRFKHELIARCQAEIQSIKTNPRQPLRHTAATMAYGAPPATCSFDTAPAYQYYSDWPNMLQNGWLDAAIPMNYKAEFSQDFRDWCDRCVTCWRYNRDIFAGCGAYLAGHAKAHNLAQLQTVYRSGLNGSVTYSYALTYGQASDTGDWWSYIASNLFTAAVSTPAMPWRNPATATEGILWGRVKDAKTGLFVDEATVTVTGGPTVKTDGNGYYVATLVPAAATGTVHSVTASKSGLTSQTIADATVLAGDIVRCDFTLGLSLPGATPARTNAATASWPSPTPDWTTRQFTNRAATNWAAPDESAHDNGASKSVVVAPRR